LYLSFRFQNNIGTFGGAIYAPIGSNVVSSTFINNSAIQGGAVMAVDSPNLQFNTFIGNKAVLTGGALHIITIAEGETDTSKHMTFIANTAQTGGAMYPIAL
jgi:predicted outer membrane repeat protein